jgi:LmbE family N-acetylglucosaminyl deacetylase
MAKIIFFQAHPDDLEHQCGHLMHYLATKSKKNHKIKIASMTKGEFGLPGAQYDKYKGEFLAKIREQELFNAIDIHGMLPESVDFFGYIDGFVKFNKDIVEKTKEYLNKEKPDIIFAPEPIYTWYYHMDHINTGKVLFYIIYNKLVDFTPKLYYYSSLSPNYFFGFEKEDVHLILNLIACHKTQYWLMNYTMMPYKPIRRFYGKKISGWKYAEPYRRVYFDKKYLNKNKPSMMIRIFSHFFSSLPWFQAKYPQDILHKLLKEKKQK